MNDKELNSTYYDPAKVGAFSGVKTLAKATKRKRNRVRDWLTYQDTYTLHKPTKRKFVRRPVIVGGMLHQFQADLIEYSPLRGKTTATPIC
jgi:hypothetical protein